LVPGNGELAPDILGLCAKEGDAVATDAAQSLACLVGLQDESLPGKPTELSYVPCRGCWVSELELER